MMMKMSDLISKYCILILFIILCSFGAVVGARLLERDRGLAVTSYDAFNHIGMGCQEMVAIHNYPCEEHTVTTQDGFIISLQRITSGVYEQPGAPTPKVPVLLQHGLFADANCWLIIGESSLGFLLANQGFDVWLSNTRGTMYSRQHTSLNPSQPQFWDWSWDQLSQYDFPAIVNYVSTQTQQRIHYVGHSLGTTIALGALSTNTPVLNQLRSASLLSPIGHLNHVPPYAYAAANLFIGEFNVRFGLGEFSPASAMATQFVAQVCALPLMDCSNFMTMLAGPSCCMNASSMSALMGHGLQSSSAKLLTQYSQDIRTGIISRYDYENPVENMMHYGLPMPPLYQMANIPTEFPLFVSYGSTDFLGDIEDVQILLGEIANHNRDKLVINFQPGYAHMDFIMANDVAQRIYEPMVAFMRSN